MLNYIWGIMIVIGIIFGAFNGTLAGMADHMLNSGKKQLHCVSQCWESCRYGQGLWR